jgi:hypothetical protein
MWRMVMPLALLMLCCGAAEANCGPVLLRIKGETKRQSSQEKILVTIAPEPSRSNPLVLLEGEKFYADVYYNPLKSRGVLFGSNCSKRPEKVTVALLVDGKEVDKKVMLFSRDFVSDGDGGYVLRTKLRLGK